MHVFLAGKRSFKSPFAPMVCHHLFASDQSSVAVHVSVSVSNHISHCSLLSLNAVFVRSKCGIGSENLCLVCTCLARSFVFLCSAKLIEFSEDRASYIAVDDTRTL